MRKYIPTKKEIEWLAKAYIELRKNKTYMKLSQNLRSFIEEWIDEELKKGETLEAEIEQSRQK